jgi:hypothetical protein
LKLQSARSPVDDPSVRNHRQRPVVVAVIAVRMMQPAVHEIVGVVAVRNAFMAAVRPVSVGRLVAGRVMLWIAAVRVPVGYRNYMLLGTPVLGMLKTAMIEVIDVAFMLHGEMTASAAMNVR